MEAKGIYLGDGAYIKEGNYHGELIIYTTDGIRVTNSISLEIHMLKHIQAYAQGLLEAYKAEADAQGEF